MDANDARSQPLTKLLRCVNDLHKNHGFTVLFNDKESFLYHARRTWLLVAFILDISLLLICSNSQFSNNTALERLMDFLIAITCSGAAIVETTFLFWRDDIRELVEWCYKVESWEPKSTLKKPLDWFKTCRSDTKASIHRYITMARLEAWSVAFVIIPLQSYFSGYYWLPIAFNFKKVAEKESLFVFAALYILVNSAIVFITYYMTFGMSLYVLFINYILGQLRLIEHYVMQLNLRNLQAEELKRSLRDIVALHIDVLRYVFSKFISS